MDFHIDVEAFLSTLPVMLNGMVGGMFVMLVICLVVMALYAIGKRGKKDKKV
ncbi:hypothetical protein LJC74_00930 [Eubacteriales bacterium OttesenSCG-928-A19]|nr:hypothetical protein [Eubacteriales bacterium OttesenSCG-928-A19]